MINVTVSVVPDDCTEHVVATAEIHFTGTYSTCDRYGAVGKDFKTNMRDKFGNVIHSGTVRGFSTKDKTVWDLVYECLDAAVNNIDDRKLLLLE